MNKTEAIEIVQGFLLKLKNGKNAHAIELEESLQLLDALKASLVEPAKGSVLLVCGGRDFKDRELVYDKLKSANPACIISGAAKGADRLAIDWAKENNIPFGAFPANWDKLPKGAGPVRNKAMLDFSRANKVLAFPGGDGTKNMIEQARERLIDVEVVEFSENKTE